MGLEEHFVCDVCQAIKRDVNRWYVVGAGPVQFGITVFTDEAARVPGVKLACGQSCLNALLGQWIQGMVHRASS